MATKDMRLVFDDADVKNKLQDLAALTDTSLNKLVNLILSAQFSSKAKLYLQLLCDLAEFKKSSSDVS